jgi:heme-degrading monooxygenase HmoA
VIQIYTMGRWRPNAGKEDAFVEEWGRFAAWASGVAGAGTLRLARDVRDPGVFVSFGVWESVEAVRGWKSLPAFRERLAHVLEHVEQFEPTELAVVAAADAGTITVHAPPHIEPVHAP